MPRPRFNKLSPQKQARILEAAAREFAAHGYEAASLNQILAEAGISKGAAYYYFDGKADLYATAVTTYAGDMMTGLPETMATVTADSFWPTLHALYSRQFTAAYEQPWVFGLVKSASRLTPEQLEETGLIGTFGQMHLFLVGLIGKGQQVGAVRRDLPQTLLINLLMAIDDALDHWLLDHWSTLTATEMQQI
ncbi:MAG: TetR/AcrR family transcriptional regulator, partial [Chloroflexota bacterium]